jgi:mono/diheme cytochrome c family protein
MENKENILVAVVIVIVLIYASLNYMNKSSSKIKNSVLQKDTKRRIYHNTEEDVVAYIVDVINNGSNRLKVSKEIMEGGYIPKDKAKDVACYVYELSGKKCTKKYSKDAAMYFSSSCAGCHGIDGKGTNGAYPDLTRKRLLGIKE